LGGQFGALGSAAVQYVCYVIQVRNEARLRAVNGGQSQTRFKPGYLGIAYAAGSDDPAQTFLSHLKRGIAGEDSADRRERGRVETPVRFLVELAFSRKRGAAGQTTRALGISDQLAQAQENVLIAGQAGHPRLFHDLG